MKQKIKVKDGNKVIERVVTLPDPTVVQTRERHHSHIFKNKKKFNRKSKYKQKFDEEM